jgi:hypothetical protein
VTEDRNASDCKQTQLTRKQLLAVDLLASGVGDRKVAETVECDASTVWRWRTSNPGFIAALNARREEVWASSLDRIRSLLPIALDVVEEALQARDYRVALNILKLSGLCTVDLGRIGSSEPGLIAESQDRARRWREQDQAEADLRAAEAEVRMAEQRSSLELRRCMAGAGI